jgi:hypothetical protein
MPGTTGFIRVLVARACLQGIRTVFVDPEVDGVRTVDLLEKVADLKGLVALMVEGVGARISAEEGAMVEEARPRVGVHIRRPVVSREEG